MEGYVQTIPYGGAIPMGGYAMPVGGMTQGFPVGGYAVPFGAVPMPSGKTIINVPAGATPEEIQAKILALCPAGTQYISSTPGAV